MAKLSSLLAAKIKAANLSFTAAADALDISAPSLRAALAGRSAPNSRSLGKYAKFLGISEEQVAAAGGPRGGKAGGKRRGRPPGKGKAAKPKGKPGRPKLPGVAKATVRLLAASVESIQKRINRMNKVIEKISKR
jgi:transcriptional regulator with XRE-family HTH domain